MVKIVLIEVNTTYLLSTHICTYVGFSAVIFTIVDGGVVVVVVKSGFGLLLCHMFDESLYTFNDEAKTKRHIPHFRLR